jgi:hypothetical protein
MSLIRCEQLKIKQMFRKLFGKNDKKSKNQETQENSKHSEIRMDLSELIEKSTIQIMTHQLFMHHQKTI